MSEKPEQTGRGWWRYVVWMVVLLVLYVPSIGPAYALHLRFPRLGIVYDRVYSPLAVLFPDGTIQEKWITWWALTWHNWLKSTQL